MILKNKNKPSLGLSRNDPCWCGSGKKYKKCHMDSDTEKGGGIASKLKPPRGVIIKNGKEIEGIKKSCQLTKEILDKVVPMAVEGITTEELNSFVHDYTIKRGATPAPLNYHGFPKSVCISINEVICHGIPGNRTLKNGDILNIDVTSILDGYYGDASRMVTVGEVSPVARKLINVTEECLYMAIDEVKPYRDMGIIGTVIELHAKKNGFSVVRDYGGHGVGVKFHEEPHVHHYDVGNRGIPMLPGMVFTIEPMLNEGKKETLLLDDDWTAVTKDGSLSAQWEHTLLVTDRGCEILTA